MPNDTVSDKGLAAAERCIKAEYELLPDDRAFEILERRTAPKLLAAIYDEGYRDALAAPIEVSEAMVKAAFWRLFYYPADYPRAMGKEEAGFKAVRSALEAALQARKESE